MGTGIDRQARRQADGGGGGDDGGGGRGDGGPLGCPAGCRRCAWPGEGAPLACAWVWTSTRLCAMPVASVRAVGSCQVRVCMRAPPPSRELRVPLCAHAPASRRRGGRDRERARAAEGELLCGRGVKGEGEGAGGIANTRARLVKACVRQRAWRLYGARGRGPLRRRGEGKGGREGVRDDRNALPWGPLTEREKKGGGGGGG